MKAEGRYDLKIDMRHYFPGGQIPEQLREAVMCRQRAEKWAFYLEHSVKDIEERARSIAESTTMSYCEAIDKVAREILEGKRPEQAVPLRSLSGDYKARPNRAQRRKAQKARRQKHGKRK